MQLCSLTEFVCICMYVNVYIMAVYVCMMLSTVRNKLYSANVNKKEKKKKKKLSMFAQVCNPSYLQASITENSGCARMFCVRYVWICVDFAHYPQMCMCNVCFFFLNEDMKLPPLPLLQRKGVKCGTCYRTIKVVLSTEVSWC